MTLGRIIRWAMAAALIATGIVWSAAPAYAVPLITQVSAGKQYACALDSTGAAYCWGLNFDGQLGNGNTTSSNVPVAVGGAHTFASISAGGHHACGLTSAGAAWCWGAGGGGQLGDNTYSTSSTPVAVSGGLTFAKLVAGDDHTCGITTGNAAYCWGWAGNGRIGDGQNSTNRGVPTAVSGGLSFSSIALGNQHTCALTTAGVAYCWGADGAGQLGDGSSGTDKSVPTAVNGGLTFASITTGYGHTCAVTTAGVAYCWGDNGSGRLGDGTTTQRTVPTAVTGGITFARVVAFDSDHTCGWTSAGVGYCWGSNTSGRLGDGTTNVQTSPTAITGGYKWLSLSIGYVYSCGLTNGGGVMCWGDNTDGELGNRSNSGSLTPVTVWLQTLTNNTTVSGIIDPALTFTVGAHAGACNGVNQTAGSSVSSTTVMLGHINSVLGAGAQDLTVSTNAASGFTVYAKTTGPFTAGGGNNIADISGTNASPGAFPSAGSEGFGYTTSDSGLGTGTPDRFTNGGAKWAKFTTTGAEVSYAAAVVNNDTVCIAIQAGASGTTKAGSYSATVIYTAVPTY